MKNGKKSVSQASPGSGQDAPPSETRAVVKGHAELEGPPPSQVDDDSLWGQEPDTGQPHDSVLFTNSALRLHLPDKLPPTPGKRRPLHRRLIRRAKKLLTRL